MVATRPSFTDLTNRAIQKVLFDTYGQKPEQYPNYFNVMSVNSGKDYIESEISSLGVIPVADEGEEVTYLDATQLYDKTYTFETYKGGFAVTEEAQEDDLHGILGKKMASMLGKSLKRTIEQYAANIYNRATNGSYTGADGVPLCDGSHPIEGGTEQNELSTAADLSVTTLRQAIQDIEATVDYKGGLSDIKPTILAVAPAEQWTGAELLKSAQDPESAHNAINPLQGRMKLMVNDYFTDADACFLLDPTAVEGHLPTQFIWRVKPTLGVSSSNDFDTGNLKYKIRARFNASWTAWRGIYLIQGV